MKNKIRIIFIINLAIFTFAALIFISQLSTRPIVEWRLIFSVVSVVVFGFFVAVLGYKLYWGKERDGET